MNSSDILEQTQDSLVQSGGMDYAAVKANVPFIIDMFNKISSAVCGLLFICYVFVYALDVLYLAVPTIQGPIDKRIDTDNTGVARRLIEFTFKDGRESRRQALMAGKNSFAVLIKLKFIEGIQLGMIVLIVLGGKTALLALLEKVADIIVKNI